MIKEQLEKSREEFEKIESELISITPLKLNEDGLRVKVNTDKLKVWIAQQQTALLEAIMKWAEEKKWKELKLPFPMEGIEDDIIKIHNEPLEELKKELTK